MRKWMLETKTHKMLVFSETLREVGDLEVYMI